MASPSPATRSLRRSRWPTSTSTSARTSAATCSPRRASSARCSRASATCRSSATCAAPATSRRSSWSRTRTPRRASSDEESEDLLRGFLSGELYRRGLICRADDRGDPVVQLAPPLIADTEQFEEIHDGAARRAQRGRAAGPTIGRSGCSRSRACSTNSASTWRPGPTRPSRRCAGSTSPSSRTRRPGSRAAS